VLRYAERLNEFAQTDNVTATSTKEKKTGKFTRKSKYKVKNQYIAA
jgi:hypothetical protein